MKRILQNFHYIVFVFFVQEIASNGLPAKTWVDQVTTVISGKGGGKDVSAQATGSNTQGLEEAMKIALDFAKLKLS